MPVNIIINGLYLVFAFIGALDYLLDNKLGLGVEFERGINSAGKLIIVMVGFMTLSTVLGRVLSPAVTPLFMAVGADPSALAGMLLANDSGGAALAMEMALDKEAGAFNGYIVASMLGSTVMSGIPMTMLSTDARTRPAAVYGLVIGLFCIPFGSLVGGIVAGFRLSMILCNLIPATALTVILFALLILFQKWIIKPFFFFGKIILAVSLAGFLLAAAREMLGLEVIAGLNPFSEVISVIGGIVLILSGVFPLLAVVMRLLKKPIQKVAAILNVGEVDILSILVTSVNLFPTFDKLHDMTPKGVLLNISFLVGANCVIGDHFAFTSQTCPKIVIPVVIAKMVTGILALVISCVLAPRLLRGRSSTSTSELTVG